MFTKRLFFWVSVFLATFTITACNKSSSDSPLNEKAVRLKNKAVIVFSLDGVGFEQLKKIDPGFISKNKVKPLIPGDPSLTFPGHATLATGVNPDIHGVKSNLPTPDEIPFLTSKEEAQTYISHSSRMQSPPIWLFARNAGIEVFIHHWAMSNHKWCGHEIRDNQESKFDDKLVEVNKTGMVVYDKLMSWDRKKDLLIYAYSLGLDPIGHRNGPYGPKTRQKWELNKQIISILHESVKKAIQSPADEIYLFFVSDHGMYENWVTYQEAINIKEYLLLKGFPEDIKTATNSKLFTIIDYKFSQEELDLLSEDFEVITNKNDPDKKAFKIKAPETAVQHHSLDKNCKKQDPDTSYKWLECRIFEGGLHDNRKPGISEADVTGVIWSVIEQGQQIELPNRQHEFVPMIAEILKLDSFKQNSINSCQITKD